ncbi:MAG: Outer rane assembly lipoprotein YfgL [Myxococcaceae bacterium]|nr:Outer rane assembly lipoprotein YfgL [Myxococcaceae bacterium]
MKPASENFGFLANRYEGAAEDASRDRAGSPVRARPLSVWGLVALLLSSCSASAVQAPGDAAAREAAAPDVATVVDVPAVLDAGPSIDVAISPDRPDVPDVPPRIDAPTPDAVDAATPVDVRRVDVADGLSPYTIDWMEWDDSNRYGPGGALQIASSIGRYGLSDGRTWRSGAGTARSHVLRYDRVAREGTTLRYALTITGSLFDRTDYDSGDDAANCRLEAAGPIEIVAAEGASTGVVRGLARVAADEPANYRDQRFHRLSAPVGSVVRYTATFTLRDATFTTGLFDASFGYSAITRFEFTSVVP